MSRFRRFLFNLLVFLFAGYWLLLSDQAHAQSENFEALGQRIVDLVRSHFFDAKRADAWASLHDEYGARADSLVGFAGLTKQALSELNTSHTDFYTPLEPEYYGLLSIFHGVLGVEPVEFEGIGIDLDFRDGWGGCNPQFMNLFNPLTPVQTYIDRNGRTRTVNEQWRKPLYLLTNNGTRSGKEVVAFVVKTHKLGTLIGETTAGAVMGGRCFLLPGKYLLYIAELDDLIDGQRLEGRGVQPDFQVPANLPYADGFDPQLEKALLLASKSSDSGRAAPD